MATKNSEWISGPDNIDTIDLAALVAFPVVAGIIFGIFSLSIDVFGGFSLADTALTIGNTSITWGMIVAILSIGWIVGTNEINGSDYDQWEYGVILFAFLSVPAHEFIPQVQNYVAANDALALGLWLAVSIAAVYVSYTE